MLTVLRDASGRLEAAAEWVPTDDHGHPSNYYSRIFVNQFEISRGVDTESVLKRLIASIADHAPAAKGAFWERRDTTGEGNVIPHNFSREALLRFASKNGHVVS